MNAACLGAALTGERAAVDRLPGDPVAAWQADASVKERAGREPVGERHRRNLRRAQRVGGRREGDRYPLPGAIRMVAGDVERAVFQQLAIAFAVAAPHYSAAHVLPGVPAAAVVAHVGDQRVRRARSVA